MNSLEVARRLRFGRLKEDATGKNAGTKLLARSRFILYLILLAWMWGSSYLFVKVGVVEIPPLTFAAGRSVLGGAILIVVLVLQGQGLPKWGGIWKHIAIAALVHNAAPYVLVALAGQHIDSGLAAIITGTTPLFTIILAHFLVADDRLTPAKLAGILVGFAGLLVLVMPAVLAGVRATTGGVVAVLLAALCYAIATVYSRNHLRGSSNLSVPAAQLMLAAVYILPLSLIIDQPYGLPRPSWLAVGALLSNGIFGTALAFVVFYRLVELANPSQISTVSYLIPVVGASLGAVVLGEPLTWNIYLGFTGILFGVMVVNGFRGARFSAASRFRPRFVARRLAIHPWLLKKTP